MRRILLITVSYFAAGAVAIVPAIIGLAGNPSFGHQLPVRAPSNARPAAAIAADNQQPAHQLRQLRSVEDGDRNRGPSDDGRARGAREVERHDDHAAAIEDREPGHERENGRHYSERGDDRGVGRDAREHARHTGRDDGGGSHDAQEHTRRISDDDQSTDDTRDRGERGHDDRGSDG